MSNRAAKYEQLHKSLKKHFKNVPEPGERSVLEHLIYACCLEDARHEQADEALAKLQQVYVDWNEVRVTTVIELGEAMSSLPNAAQAGHRIKRCLQSLFEARYQYDIDDLKKANLSKATDEISSWKGVTPFILNYVSQNALGGHAIPVDSLGMEMLVQCDILTQAELEKKSVPGLERAIPKNKGFEFGSLLHQFSVEFKQSPKNASVLAVFKELGVSPKPKAVEKPVTMKEPKPSSVVTPLPSEARAVPTKTEAAASEASKKAGKSEPAPTAKKTEKTEKATAAVGKSKDAPVKPESKPEPVKATEAKKKAEVKDTDVKKPEVKKPEVKKPEVKKPEVKKPEVKKTEVMKTEEKKPDKEAAGKKQDKPAVKKPDAKSTSKQSEAATPAKASKPEVLAKKSVTTIKPSTSKPDSSAKPTKKKPR